jgi:hypothetical protein
MVVVLNKTAVPQISVSKVGAIAGTPGTTRPNTTHTNASVGGGVSVVAVVVVGAVVVVVVVELEGATHAEMVAAVMKSHENGFAYVMFGLLVVHM